FGPGGLARHRRPLQGRRQLWEQSEQRLGIGRAAPTRLEGAGRKAGEVRLISRPSAGRSFTSDAVESIQVGDARFTLAKRQLTVHRIQVFKRALGRLRAARRCQLSGELSLFSKLPVPDDYILQDAFPQ